MAALCNCLCDGRLSSPRCAIKPHYHSVTIPFSQPKNPIHDLVDYCVLEDWLARRSCRMPQLLQCVGGVRNHLIHPYVSLV